MKRLLLAAAIFVTGSPLFAQSLQILDLNNNVITDQTIDIWVDQTYATYSSDFNVKNISGNTKKIMARRHQTHLAGTSTELFCWVLCYGPNTNFSPTAASMPSTSTHIFTTHIFHNGNYGNDTIIYNFYDSLNVSDSSRFRVVWHVTPTGVNNLAPVSGNISNIYPNPAISNTTINYTLINADQAYLKLFDMLGNELKRISINPKEGSVNLSVSDLRAGIYFCSIIADEKTISTQKFTVIK